MKDARSPVHGQCRRGLGEGVLRAKASAAAAARVAKATAVDVALTGKIDADKGPPGHGRRGALAGAH